MLLVENAVRLGVFLTFAGAALIFGVDAMHSYRLWGLLPIWQWVISLANPETQPQDKRLLFIERIQALSMLVYYPVGGLDVVSWSCPLISPLHVFAARTSVLFLGQGPPPP